MVAVHRKTVDADLYKLGPDGIALTDLSQSAMMTLRLELDESFRGSVEFVIYNSLTLTSIPTVENSHPYSLMGDAIIADHLNYRGWRATVGQHTVYIRMFAGKDLSGEELCSQDVTFVVVPHRDAPLQTTVYSTNLHRGGCTAPESHIDGLAECSDAGASLGLAGQVAQTNPQLHRRRPYGCTWDEGRAPDGSKSGYLRWNALGRWNMDDELRRSICKIVTPGTRVPTPSPTTSEPATPAPTLAPATSEPTASPSPTAGPTPGPTDTQSADVTLPACALLVDMALVDAEAHEVLGPLVRGSTVNLADLGTNQLSTVLTWSGSPNVKSVAFYLDSAAITTTENAAPWSLLGDTGRGRGNLQYAPWAATAGNHTILAELFDKKKRKGERLCAVTYTFTIVDGVLTPADPASVSSTPTSSLSPSPTASNRHPAPTPSPPTFAPTPILISIPIPTPPPTPTVPNPVGVPLMLVDASTVPATDLHLVDGDAIRLTSIGTSKISIRYEYAMVSSEPPASVTFDVTGTGADFSHLETSAPFTLLGDKKRRQKYTAWSPDAGVYELTVTAFAGAAGNGEVLHAFVTTLMIQEGPVANKRAKYATKLPKLPKLPTDAGASHDDASSNSATEGTAPTIGLKVAAVLVVFVCIVAVFGYYGRGQRQSPELAGGRHPSDGAASSAFALSDRSNSAASSAMSWDLDYQLLNVATAASRPAVTDALASTTQERFVHAPVKNIGERVDSTGSYGPELTTHLKRSVSLDWDDASTAR